MKSRIKLLSMALGLHFLIAGCQKDDGPGYQPVLPYGNGGFISNEGTFGLPNSSVSFYSYSGDSISNDIFQKANGKPLGQVLQSIHLSGSKAYLVLNLSDTVVVVNSGDFKMTGTITQLSLPRWMTSYNGKGYITQWGGGGVVKVADLAGNNVIRTIDVGTGPEQVIFNGTSILVCNGGGFDLDSTISVINPASDRVESTIVVGDNPKEMTLDKNRDIWVLCYGYIKYDSLFQIEKETPSKLVHLNGQSLQKLAEYVISPNKHPQNIDVSKDGTIIYYGGGFGFTGIYAMSINASSAPAEPLIDGGKSFYGFNVNPFTGEIFAFDALDFTAKGIMTRYSAGGGMIRQYSVGIAPNGAVFK